MIYRYVTLIFLFLFLYSYRTNASEIIPIVNNDTIFFEYNPLNKKILIEGTINDTINVNIFFDTGLPTDEFIVSDNLKKHIGDENVIKLKNSSYEQLLTPRFYPYTNQVFQKYGSNTITVGWEFFLDKVIKISYKEEYLVIIDDVKNIPNLDTYESIPFKTGTIFPYMLIPAKIDIMGVTINDDAIVDTGANMPLVLKDSLLHEMGFEFDNFNMQTAYHGGKSIQEIRLIADNLQIGKFSMIDCYASYSYSSKSFDSKILIGNQFWEQYDVIFDFIDFAIYMKEQDLGQCRFRIK